MRALACALALAAACGSSRPRGDLGEGERLYLSKCTSCHAYDQHDYSPARWRSSVAQMEADNKVTLTREEKAAILGYLEGPEKTR